MKSSQKISTTPMLIASLMTLALSTPSYAERNPCSPCAPKAKAQHQHDMKNPCAAKNPCATKNPCEAAKHPCAAKNPCAAKKY